MADLRDSIAVFVRRWAACSPEGAVNSCRWCDACGEREVYAPGFGIRSGRFLANADLASGL